MNSKHSNTFAAAYIYCSRAKGVEDAMIWLWVGLLCKRREGFMMVSGGPFAHFLSGQEVSTPWSACTAAGQQHGCCSHTHCHTWKEKQRQVKVDFNFISVHLIRLGRILALQA